MDAGPFGTGDPGGVAEKRNDAKVTREYELARPAELDAGQSAIGPYFAEDIRDRYGVAVLRPMPPHDFGDDENHHAPVMTTTRVVDADGLGQRRASSTGDLRRRSNGEYSGEPGGAGQLRWNSPRWSSGSIIAAMLVRVLRWSRP